MILINSSSKNALKIFQPFLPVFVPIGLGVLAAACEQQGIDTFCLDEQVENDMMDRIETYVSRLSKPYIFGFSVLTAALKSALELASNVKTRYPDSVVVFGGIHPSAAPEEVLLRNQVDIVIRGEGEQILTELYRRIKSDREYFDLDGLSYKKNGTMFHNNLPKSHMDLDELPPFPYHLFEDQQYDSESVNENETPFLRN